MGIHLQFRGIGVRGVPGARDTPSPRPSRVLQRAVAIGEELGARNFEGLGTGVVVWNHVTSPWNSTFGV